MKILLVYLPFCTPVSPPYSLTNLHAFLSHNSKQEIKVLDLNIKFHQLKFKDAQQYFQLGKWKNYENYISVCSLKWIWIMGVMELGILGILYHQVPQLFPSFIAVFFFA